MLVELAGDPERLRTMGAAARELVSGWGHGPSVAGFARAVHDAAAAR